jgi:hypothetical protein
MIGSAWTVPIYQKKLNFIYLNPNMMEKNLVLMYPYWRGK